MANKTFANIVDEIPGFLGVLSEIRVVTEPFDVSGDHTVHSASTTSDENLSEFDFDGVRQPSSFDVSGDHTVHSASTTSDENLSEFFDFDRACQPSSATSCSDAASVMSTSASGEQGKQETQHRMQLKELQSSDDHLTVPQPDKKNPPPRELSLRIREASTGRKHPRSSEPTLGLLDSDAGDGDTSSSEVSRRQRNLPNPEKTKIIRDVGACLGCRIRRINCTTGDVCGQCQKMDGDARKALCIRKKLTNILGKTTALSNRWWDEYHLGYFGNERYYVRHGIIMVLASPDLSGPRLPLPVEPQPADQDVANCRRYGFAPNRQLSDDTVRRWAEAQIRHDGASDFRSSVELLLIAFKARNMVNNQQHLVDKVLLICGMRRIWASSCLYCCDGLNNNKPQALPSPIHDYLRRLARLITAHHEMYILRAIDGYLEPGAIKPSDAPETWACLWACLWAMMLLYRDAIAAYSADKSRDHKGFLSTTKRLYEALIATYSALFRTSKVFNSLESYKEEHSTDQDVSSAFKTAWNLRQNFYHEVRDCDDELNGLLEHHILAKERQGNGVKRRKRND